MSTIGMNKLEINTVTLVSKQVSAEGQKWACHREPISSRHPFGKGNPQHLLGRTGRCGLIYELVKGPLIRRVSI